MKKIINITMFVLFAVAVAGLMGFIYIEQGKQVVNELVININHADENGFLSENLLKEMIHDYDSLSQKTVNQINTQAIESSLYKNPFIELADAYISIDKDLIINAEEKQPFLRIYNRKSDGFYIDHSGKIFPLSDNFTARVMLVNGYINITPIADKYDIFDSVYSNTPLVDLFSLCRLVDKNSFLKAQIGQVYVNSRGEFDLVPQLGTHLIRFGTMEDAPIKLNNLEVFYKKALIGEGWDKYETINLKYKNQVVCKRK